MNSAAPYLRILLAWLIAMQPLLGAYAAAQAARAPLTMELCRSAISGDETPVQPRKHTECCLAACAQTAAPAPCCVFAARDIYSAKIALKSPSRVGARAELDPRSARAPPVWNLPST